ncbi:MAG: hypothetical protein ABR510_06445 [Trueperaceae bacterium]
MRRPIDLYAKLLDAADIVAGTASDEDARVALLRRVLRTAEALPAPVARVVDAAGVTRAYLLRHVLSIRAFAPDVRAALREGLPLAVARQVNGLATAEARAWALEPLAGVGAFGRLLPRGVAAQVERRARGARDRGSAPPPAAGKAGRTVESGLDAVGWRAPDPDPRPPADRPGDVWTFAAAGPRRDAEALAPEVVEALLARLLPSGGRLVDATAGAGTIADVARRHGVATWSGDLEPRAPFVHRADAALLGSAPEGPGSAVADVLVVHPPTYRSWAAAAPDVARMEQVDGYADAVAAMVAGAMGVVAPGGFVVVVTRPVREPGAVWLATSHLAQQLTDADLTLERYVLAVADDGSEEWHVLVGRTPKGGARTVH